MSSRILKQHQCDLSVTGVRKYEGGIRSQRYKSCFNTGDKTDEFRPIFWYTENDRKEYEDFYEVEHSRCYTEYDLKRTGCAGCPYGRHFEDELMVLQTYEPLLYRAALNIFGDSYEYTRLYKEFRKQKENERG